MKINLKITAVEGWDGKRVVPEAPELAGLDIRPATIEVDSKTGRWVAHIQGYGRVESAPGTPAGRQQCLRALAQYWHRQYEMARQSAEDEARYEAEKRARWEEANRIRKERSDAILAAFDASRKKAERLRQAADASWVTTGRPPESPITWGDLEARYLAEEWGDDWDWPLMPGPSTSQLLADWAEAAETFRFDQAAALDLFHQQGYTPSGRESVRYALPEPRRIDPEKVEILRYEAAKDGLQPVKAAVPTTSGFDWIRVFVPASCRRDERKAAEAAIRSGAGERWDGTNWVPRI